MANRYFIAGGATANWNDPLRWSSTSGGNGGASIPTSSDNAIFDANSLSAPCNLTINAEANCLDLDFSGLDNLLTLTNSTYNLNVYGNLTLTSNTYLATAFSGTGYLQLRATTSVNITSNGCTREWNRINFDGVGGTWTFQDNLSSASPLYFFRGIVNFGTHTYNISGFIFDVSSVEVTLNMDSSTVVTPFLTLYHYGVLNFNCGTSTFNIKSFASNGFGTYVTNRTFYNLSYEQIGNNTLGGGMSILAPFTVLNNLTLVGQNSQIKRLIVQSSGLGTPRTITVNGSIVASNVDFRDITLAGTANRDLSAITGGSGDCGGNSGITFTPAANQYFKHSGTSTVNWSDTTKWFTTSGGSVQGRVPLPQDDAIFDANSFDANCTLNVNVPRIGGLNMEGVNRGVSFIRSGSMLYEIHKSVNIPNSNITIGNQLPMHMYGRGFFTFHCKPQTAEIRFYSGTYSVTSDVTAVSYFQAFGISTVYLGDNYIKTPYFRVSDQSKMYCENATIEVNATNEFGVLISSPYLYAENSTIKLTATGTALVAIQGAPLVAFNILYLSGLHTGFYNIRVNTTIAELIIDGGRKVQFTNGTTQTIAKLTSNGTPSNKVTIQSTTAGSQATINYTGIGTPFIENVILKDINFTVPVYALNGTNLGNNTNVKYVWKVAKKTMGFPIRLVKDE